MSTEFDVRGKRIVVTGGASGIGEAISRRLARVGATVFVIDRNSPDSALLEMGVTYLKGSVDDDAQMRRVYSSLFADGGPMDGLVSNAGIAGMHPIDELDGQRAKRYFEVNALGALYAVRAAVDYMRSGGSIVTVGALSGEKGTPGYTEYAMSKAAITSLTRSAAVELGPRGIRANCVIPGGIMTPLSGEVNGDTLNRLMRMLTPVGRIGEPDDVAGVVHFLISDEARYLTGQGIYVDGGWSTGTTVAAMDEFSER
jgi:NAD(P)-dependent dehydrogenase (short-subunit alcohol dehydrogenase family)